jgi:hypothetical protein
MLTSRDLKHKYKGQGKGGGRPASITSEKSAKLIVAIEHGFTLAEALQQAEISDDAYRRLLKKSPKFRGEIATAKRKLAMLARYTIANAIKQGDMTTVRWWAERKIPEEFGRQAIERDTNTLPPGFTVVLPGTKPHPRITIDPDNPMYKYADDIEVQS